MRPGLRPALLLLVSVLLGLAFAPLYWTAATFSRVSLARTEYVAALSFGRTVGHAIADGKLDPEILQPLVGLRLERSDGTLLELGRSLPKGTTFEAGQNSVLEPDPERGVVWSSSRGHEGTAYVGVRLEDHRSERASFVGLLGIYMGLLGVGLLIAIYVALTFLIVRPLDELGRAARRVTLGTRPFGLPKLPARELMSLGQSFHVMTERLLTEEQSLKTRIAEVNEANLRLKEAQERLLRSERLASVGRLSAGLAHEVGNPIAAMLGLEELLLQGGLSPAEERDFLQRIHRETERVHRILRDLLDFARPSASIRPNALEEPGDVKLAIEETVALVRPQKLFREIEIEWDKSASPPLVTLSRQKLVQVLLNLFLNAADAMDGKGRIAISTSESGTEHVKVTVADNGPGVPFAIRRNLFEPFVTTKDVGHGTGLGLAVCRGLVEGREGTIELCEDSAAGATFVLRLPRAALIE